MLKEKIAVAKGKTDILKIVQSIGTNPEKINELIALIKDTEHRPAQWAGWTFQHWADAHPQRILPYLPDWVEILQRPKLPNGVIRPIVRTWSLLEVKNIEEDTLGRMVDICFKILIDPKQAVANKAHSMSFLWNVCAIEPDLKGELKLVIEEQMPYATTGFKSRGSKILKAINRS